MADTPEWAVALAVEIHDMRPCHHPDHTGPQEGCFLCVGAKLAAAFDAQAGKLREEFLKMAESRDAWIRQANQAEERAEADATEIMRLQGELAEERGRIAKEKA